MSLADDVKAVSKCIIWLDISSIKSALGLIRSQIVQQHFFKITDSIERVSPEEIWINLAAMLLLVLWFNVVNGNISFRLGVIGIYSIYNVKAIEALA